MDFTGNHIEKNVIYLTGVAHSFSDIYIAVREKEHRILTDKDVAILPYLKRNEWEYREKSTERFVSYISSKKEVQTILDVGCGNGWFTHTIAKAAKNNNVIGIDVNRKELEQAARLFKRNNLQFIYGDIFKIKSTFEQQFDIITLNSCVQYFPNFKALLSVLNSFLKPGGELHIIDSPFYKKDQITAARERTQMYYKTIGVPEMAKNYFHHNQNLLVSFDALYKNNRKLINKILSRKDSPFSWYRRYKA